MAYLIKLKSFTDKRGRLTVMDKSLPFDFKRLYYISEVTGESERGGHAHHLTIEAIFCVHGSFTVVINNGKTREEFFLNDHTHCLIVEPFDWHMMYNFSRGAILMGASSTHYDHSDYYFEEPKIS
ncbi:MAG TPA: FdtA/QdtA family cupin domain-containing protein [Puia sp.]|nr:FdtA/QdtA family cupin domain-containing protein [Puia sp.]